MGERKVLNKYFPPDFDPSKVPRMRRPKGHQVEVRMMLPFNIQCTACSEFMYRGKKFNSKKEDVEGEDYLGIKKYRFYIKCVTCNQEITFKTDPENSDYAMEVGATRNFECWKDEEAKEKKFTNQRESEDKNDPMKALENRTLDSKIEMDILDALDEIRAVNTRHERLNPTNLIDKRKSDERNEEDLKDEEIVKAVRFKSKKMTHKILSDSDEEERSKLPMKIEAKGEASNAEGDDERPIFVLKKRKVLKEKESEGLGDLLGHYGSSDGSN
mmetsp:Transcript_3173/g.4913  ORF Transcript_3173/g.4913 Transcript_3173/m.4913 type:complete len:271 (+) Transcript_3173:35-847(+)